MNKNCKLIIYFLILLFPFIANAEDNDIKIKSIDLVEKTENVVELEKAKFENLEVWVNLKFFELNDSVKYKLVIENTSDKEYKFNSTGDVFTKEKYISYTFDFEDTEEIFKPGTEKVMYVIVKYETEVADGDYVENIYTNDNYMNFSFDINEKEQEIILDADKDSTPNVTPNPDTNVGSILIIAAVAIGSFVLLVFSFKRKDLFFGIALVVLLIPVISKALELYKVHVNVYVEIERKEKNLGIFQLTCASDEYFQFEKGMTFVEWFESDYNTIENLGGSGDSFHYPGAHGPAYITEPRVDDLDNTEIIDGTSYICIAPSVAECVAPDSKILTGINGNTKFAMNMKENDNIVYYDFEENIMKVGKIKKTYIHKNATDFIKYTLNDGSYIEATDYHPIYTNDGWKSYTNRNGYPTPAVGDKVKTNDGWKEIIKIENYFGKEDFYDFKVVTWDGKNVDNYYANGILVHSAY